MTSIAMRKTVDRRVAAQRKKPDRCALVLPDQEVLIPASAQTLAGFRAWSNSDEFPERGRISFIDQEIFIDMSQEELETHVKIKGEITYGIMGLNKKLKIGQVYPDGTMVTNVEANLSTGPDATFVTWKALDSGRVRLVPREGAEGQYMELEGSPDWILEVVSESSVTKDTKRLLEGYHRAGIREYWLIDARGTEIDFQILIHHESGYVPAPAAAGWQRSRVFQRRFRLGRKRGRRNLWEYTLQVKSLR